MLAGGCDMIHAGPECDLGITGLIKIAHTGESLGIDMQVHLPVPKDLAPAWNAIGIGGRRTASRSTASPLRASGGCQGDYNAVLPAS